MSSLRLNSVFFNAEWPQKARENKMAAKNSGYVSSLYFSKEKVTIVSDTVVGKATVEDYGELYVHEDGVVSSNVVHEEGYMDVSSGCELRLECGKIAPVLSKDICYCQTCAFDTEGNYAVKSNTRGLDDGSDSPAVYVPYTVPQGEYMYGCTVTVVGMLLGYYDHFGYQGYNASDLIEGTVELDARGLDGDAYDMDAFDTVLGRATASQEYVARFVGTTPEQEYPWTFVDGTTELNTAAWNCLADYLGTGQIWRGNEDLSTQMFYNITLETINNYPFTSEVIHGDITVEVPDKYSDFLYGLSLYVQEKGYSLDAQASRTVATDNNDDGSFTFEDYQAEIDSGHPVIISVANHTMLGYGYDPMTREIIFDDTYLHDCRMEWGGSYYYSDAWRPMQSVTIVHFDTSTLRYEFMTKISQYATSDAGGGIVDWREDDATGWAEGFDVRLATETRQLALSGLDANGLELLNAPDGEMNVSVKPSVMETWTDNTLVLSNDVQTTPQVFQAEDNGFADVMFATPGFIWADTFQARHVGAGTWEGTREIALLGGKNALNDIFDGGSDDTTILLLTDDANGDAIFVDDVFSALPDGLDGRSRLANIDEIRAGAGDDVVDLTSQQYAYDGKKMTVRGGLGDDVIWANHVANQLFGDAGNDRLVGAKEDDLLAGGAGDDSLHGGGGSDIFAFGGTWGNDSVEQLPDGYSILWFDGVTRADLSLSANSDGQAVLSCASGTVTLANVNFDEVSEAFDNGSDVLSENLSLRFGGEEDPEKYADMLAAGAFLDSTSDYIFEPKGALA